jgi:PAS domain S-box-containing protein
MKREISYKEIEKDLAELNKALKTIKKKAEVEKAINNIIENVRFQATELRKKEEELEKEREFSKSILDSAPGIYVLVDKKGRWLDMNKGWCELVGYSKEEQIGKTTPQLPCTIHPNTLDAAKSAAKSISQAIKEGKVPVMELPYRTKDGRRIIVRIELKRIGVYRIYIGVDVTELRKREKELRDKERDLRNAISNFGSVLSSAAKGDLTQKVDLLKIPAEYRPIGDNINSMISATQKNIDELRKREQEQANAISTLSKVLGMTATGDLSARVDTKGWSEELEVIGMAINSLIESLEFEKKEKK